MSVTVMSDVWWGFPGGGSELLTLLALADYGGDDGLSIHPSIETLAHKVRVSESQVRRVIRTLEAKKFVMVVGNHAGGAAGTTRQYRINVRLLKQLADKAREKAKEDRGNRKKATIPDFDDADFYTGRMDATPSMDARDGSHGCAGRVAPMRETGCMDATLTTIEALIEPPINHHISPTAFASVAAPTFPPLDSPFSAAPTPAPAPKFTPVDSTVLDVEAKPQAQAPAPAPTPAPAQAHGQPPAGEDAIQTGTALEAILPVNQRPVSKPAPRKAQAPTLGGGPGTTETALQAACRATWTAYSTAYANRYGVAPLRNAKVNSAIKGFVQRIGHEESPAVAAYYVSNVNDSFVVRQMHDTGLLLKSAEGYRTQWATGRAVTATAARQADQTAANMSVVEEAKQIARARRAARQAAAAAGEDFL